MNKNRTNHFADELERLLSDKKLSQVDVSSRSSISQSQISKWLRGEQNSINSEQMEALVTAITNDPQEQAAIVRAHLLDEKFGPGANLVEVIVKGASKKNNSGSRGDKAVRFLGEIRMTDRTANDLLIDLARALGAKI